MHFPGSREEDLTVLEVSTAYPRELLPTRVEHEDVAGFKKTYSWFKLRALTTGESNSTLSGDMSQSLAQELLRKFLGEVLVRIREFYEDTKVKSKKDLPPWREATIDFMFSIPSTVGEDGALILQTAAEEAGFSYRAKNAKHKVRDIALTEPEAAALAVVREEKALFKARLNFWTMACDIHMLNWLTLMAYRLGTGCLCSIVMFFCKLMGIADFLRDV
jgi:hypothetical protein